MSENLKQQRPGATPIKNPLLVASVTGITFDDFPNKPLLLPAAPPIVPTTIPATVVTREQKSLVTLGSSSLDTENLDEINLNTTNEENQSADISDTNENPLLNPSSQDITNDSILSQAASSFSALPSVASNVFSTFSKRITAISSRETTPFNDQNLQDSNANTLLVPQIGGVQPTYTQQQQSNPGVLSHGENYLASPIEATIQADTQANLSALEPPKFYTPSEVPSISKTSNIPPPSVGGQNNFRFSSKKKLYAPIPGLSDQAQQPTVVLEPSAVSDSYADRGYISTNLYKQPQSAPSYPNLEVQKPEERKAASGIFSKITNLAPTGVLQNITGLVQSATGSLSQINKLETTQEYNSTQPSQAVFEQQNNYFEEAPLPVTNSFVPPLQSFQTTSSNITNTSSENKNQTNTLPLPPASVFFQNTSATTTLQTDIPAFTPLNFPNQASISTTLQPSPDNKHPSRPSLQSSSSYIQPITNTVSKVELFDPTIFLPSHHSTSNSQLGSSASSLPPLSGVNTVPLKSAGPTSYRLQKGTKLYKNPLSPHETAPIHVTPNQIQSIYQTEQSPYPTLYPAPSQSVPLFAPPSYTEEQKAQLSTEKLKSNIQEQNIPFQSVPLFAPPPYTGEHKAKESEQSVSLIAPLSTEKLKPNIQEQNIPLFTSSGIGEQKTDNQAYITPLFAPSIEQTKSIDPEPKPDNQSQSTPLFSSPSTVDLKLNDQKQNISLFDPFKGEHYSNNQLIALNPITKEETTTNQNQTKSLFVTSAEENESNQKIALFTPISLEEQKPVDNKDIISVQELTSNESVQVAATFSASTSELPTSEIIKNVELKQDISNKNLIDNQSIVQAIEPIIEEVIEKPNQISTEDCLDQNLNKLSISSNFEKTKTLTLPPANTQAHVSGSGNPYRRGSTTDTLKPAVQPTLANFFTPEPSSSSLDLNFFATLPAQEPQLPNLEPKVNFFSEAIDNKPSNTIPVETANFFASSNTPVEPNTAIQPPITDFFPNIPNNFGIVPAVLEDRNSNQFIETIQQSNIPPPIGFENFFQPLSKAPDSTTVQQETKNQKQQQQQQPEIVNRFSKYFNQTQNQLEIVKDPSTFFDSFAGQISKEQQLQQQQQQQELKETVSSSVETNEEQRIQYFFNNPPPKNANAVGDLNYDLVHSGLGIKNIQQRSLTPISNLVEPPSSACSEFSELNSSIAGQKSFVADLSITENSEKPPAKQELKSENISKDLEQQTSSEIITNEKHCGELSEDLFSLYNTDEYKELLKDLRMLSTDRSTTNPEAGVSYKPAVKHWFYKRTTGGKHVWVPFSHYDSALLETSLIIDDDDKSNIVAVEGGRYDVNVSERKKTSVYWDSEPIEVRRCSWFYKAVDSKYVPYEEETAELLENEYRQAAESGTWPKTIILGMSEKVVVHGPTIIVHYQQQQNADAWGGTTQTTARPRVVKRDLDDFNIEQGESQKVDHLLFMVHGIGSACDLKLRCVEEVVEDFRTIARQLVQSHYRNSSDLGLVGRVEVLPISWHSHLHSVEMGIDEKLRMITLESIPKLRNFTNDTLLDILFYTSPTFCQKIMNTVVSSLNCLYLKYRERNPDFNGGVSLAGHSLGSLILFDLLCNQNPIKESEEKNLENPDQFLTSASTSTRMDSNQLQDKQMSYTMGPAGTGQPFINYGQLIFQPKKFFALGSPIGMFVTIRGIDKLGLDFRLPTCPGFYNIFHPYDPVAYRIEALVNSDLSGVRPVLIPHHKGRKRMHLELKETMTRVSMDLKNRFLDKFKTTLESVNIFGSSSKSTKEAEELMEKEVDKVIQMQMQLEQQNRNQQSTDNNTLNGATATTRQRTDSISTCISDDIVEIDFPLGKLNDSKRIDYVLQEAPLEFINEYIFALSSHVCYWDSEDTILFVMKEIYSGLGISPDSQVPQQTMTIERPSSRNSLLSSS